MIINPHEQHRERLRKMFLYCNPERLPDHMLLEFLLCYSIPRIDTNPLAHELIRRFGSLENVLDAEVEELMNVEGVGEGTALLLKMVPLFCNRYALNKLTLRTDFRSIEQAVDFFREYYISKSKEMVCALLLDNANRLICNVELYEGAVNSSNINTRKLVQIALSYNAAGLILAHNHPSGDPTPSDADLYTTKQLMKALSAVDLNLRAHLVIAGNRYADVVQTVYEHAKYDVKYVAFRADDQPHRFLDEEEMPWIDRDERKQDQEQEPWHCSRKDAECRQRMDEDEEDGRTVVPHRMTDEPSSAQRDPKVPTVSLAEEPSDLHPLPVTNPSASDAPVLQKKNGAKSPLPKEQNELSIPEAIGLFGLENK